MSTNTKKTSDKVATLASETLRNPNSSAIAKKLAASAMSQADGRKQTGADMEGTASNVLSSDKYSELTKTLAATVLSQSNKERKGGKP